MPTTFDSLRFPLALDEGLGRLQRETDHARYVEQLIRQVVLTDQGERIFRAEFGSGIRRHVFSPNSVATAALMRTAVYQALERWLPTLIRVEDVIVEGSGETLNVRIRYTLLRRGERRFLNVEVTI